MPDSPKLLDRLKVLAYATEGKAPTYRAVMRVFFLAKSRYVLRLRAEDVADELALGGYVVDAPDLETLERELDALVGWGNLERTQETTRARTLAEFLRRRSVYQLTPAGEAAERAVGELADAMAGTGSLQTVMLAAILANLRTLAVGMASGAPEPATLYTALFNLDHQFANLTANASSFMSGLHRVLDATDVHADTFLAYKQAVIAYLEQFVAELARLTPPIAESIAAVERLGAPELCRLAASADEAPALGDDGVDLAAELHRRWEGLASWFRSDGARPATVELLRGAARDAISRILAVLEHINEKRFRRVNRSADLVRLAHWFDQLGTDAEGHRLFQGAFGLGEARHLGLAEMDPETTPAATSWWDAPAVAVAAQLRRSGRHARTGTPPRIEDHSAAKAFLAAQVRLEREQAEAAAARFTGRGPFSVSQLGRLDPHEFSLFLRLVERALTAPGQTTVTSDGALAVVLHRPADGATAAVATRFGHLTCADYTVEVIERRPTLALAGAAG